MGLGFVNILLQELRFVLIKVPRSLGMEQFLWDGFDRWEIPNMLHCKWIDNKYNNVFSMVGLISPSRHFFSSLVFLIFTFSFRKPLKRLFTWKQPQIQAQTCLLKAFLWDKKKPWKHVVQKIKPKKQEQVKMSGIRCQCSLCHPKPAAR